MQPGTQIISIKVAHSLLQSGHVTLCKVGQRKTVWCKTAASHAKPLISNPPNLHDQARALQCQQVISKSQEPAKLSRFPLALSPKTKKTRSYTSCENTHVTSGVNTRQTPSNLTGIRTMETTAWQLDALSSRDRRGSGRRGLSRRSGRVDI
jgi:hypothetical protein